MVGPTEDGAQLQAVLHQNFHDGEGGIEIFFCTGVIVEVESAFVYAQGGEYARNAVHIESVTS